VSKKALAALVCGLWIVSASAGMYLLLKFETDAGPGGKTPTEWPVQSRIALDPRRFTLVLFAHPQCPCTRASIENLNHLLARCGNDVATYVDFVQPANESDTWLQTDRWKAATALPGVTVRTDQDGAEARRFGAETSGYVVLFNPQGKLLFAGGITSSRGHQGDTAGEDSILADLKGQPSSINQTPVYGCLLTTCSQRTE